MSGRREVCDFGHVVEADDAQGTRQLAAFLVQDPEQAERHQVVAREHGCHLRIRGERSAELVAGLRAPVADRHRRDRRTCSLERRTPARDALLRLQPVDRPGDVPDGAVAQIEEVLRREYGARELVDRCDRDALVGPRFDRDDRKVVRQLRNGARVGCLRRDHQDPVDALGAEPLDRVEHRAAVERRQADDADRIARLMSRALDPDERRGGPVERVVETQDAERLRLPGRQRASDRVRPVVEHAHRGAHLFARVLGDLLAAVDHARDGLMRDAREFRDVGHHRAARLGSRIAGLRHRAALRISTNRCRRMNANRSRPITIFVHHELSVPWKLISVWIRPSTRTPRTVPAR